MYARLSCPAPRWGAVQLNRIAIACSARPQPARLARRQLLAARAQTEGTSPADEPQGLLPEDDYEIPGTYRDAMTSNTPLGKAVKEACEELNELAALERQTLEEADVLLKKLGLKKSLFDVPAAALAGEGDGGKGAAEE